MKRLRLVFVLALLAAVGALAGDRPATARAADDSTIKVAVFDVDATPPVGSAMAYDPVKRVDELTLRCRGIALVGAGKPIVVCAVDWIGIANEGQDAFRDALAEAAGTMRDAWPSTPSTSTTPRAAISPPSGSSRKWAWRITAASKGRFTAR